MKHLFIIDPKAGTSERVGRIIAMIRGFSLENRGFDFDVHIVRWSRDAVSFVRRYAESSRELVRVYSTGGDRGLFEVVNGIIGLPNAQVACLDIGRKTNFVRGFGEGNIDLFGMLENLVYAGTAPVDIIKCGMNYAINSVCVSFYAKATKQLSTLAGFVGSISFKHLSFLSGFYYFDSSVTLQTCDFEVDGRSFTRRCGTIFINNGSSVSLKNIINEARPDDGRIDLLTVSSSGTLDLFCSRRAIFKGKRALRPEKIQYESCQRIIISSETPMYATMDEEVFIDNRIELEILPGAVDFVVPRRIMS